MKNSFIVFLILLKTNLVCSQWIPQDTIPNVTSLYGIKFFDKNTGFAVGANGTILKTIDADASWKLLKSGYKNALRSIVCIDANKIFIAGDDILKSTDSGETWTVYSIGDGNELYSMCFIDSLNGFAVGKYGIILKTTNGGKTWSKSYNATPYNAYDVCFLNKDTGFVACDDGIYLTTNSGKNWQKRYYFIDSQLLSLFFTNNQTGYAVQSNGRIIKTDNGGYDWYPIKDLNNYSLNKIVFVTNNTGYAFGYNGSIYKTEDAGASWRKFYGLNCTYIASACFTDSVTGYVLSERNILKTTNGGGLEDTTYVIPKLTITANVDYWDCTYAMVSANFTVDSVMPDDSICWDLGDGFGGYFRPNYSTSGGFSLYSISIPNVKAGKYSITLKYKRRHKISTITKPNAIILSNPPQPDFILNTNPDSIYAPSTINFINKTIKGTGDTLMFNWVFPDGTTSNDTNPTYTFLKPNTYYVSLSVKDNMGCNRTIDNYIVVKDTIQRNEINYIISGCYNYETPPCGYDMHFIIQNDTLKIYGYIGGNCCTKKTAVVLYKNDTINIRTFEVGQECTCDCGFCFSIKVPNVNNDSIEVLFDGQLFLAKKTLTTIRINPYVNNIRIFPNPISGDFTIDYSGLNNQKIMVEIYDIYGHLVYKNLLIESKILKLHSDNLKSGFYLVRTFGDNKNIYMNKIIINNNAR